MWGKKKKGLYNSCGRNPGIPLDKTQNRQNTRKEPAQEEEKWKAWKEGRKQLITLTFSTITLVLYELASKRTVCPMSVKENVVCFFFY